MQGKLGFFGSFSINYKYLEFERTVEMGALKLVKVIFIFYECCSYKYVMQTRNLVEMERQVWPGTESLEYMK